MLFSNKKKCLFVLPDLSGGGAEKVTLTLLRHLDRDKFSPSLFIFKEDGAFLKEVPSDIPLIIGVREKHSKIMEWFKILFSIRKLSKDYDIVIGSLELKGIFFAVVGAFFAGTPSIAWVHKHLGFYFRQHSLGHRIVYWMVAALVFSIARKVTTVSQEAADSLKSIFPWCKQKIDYHYNPIDYALIDKEIIDYKNNYPVTPLLAVGRLTPQKGFDVLLAAMSYVVKKRPNIELLILGEGEQREILENQIKQLNLTRHVHLVGFHSPYYAMAHADLLVMSSRYEGLPTVMLEAMYCGAAIVSTKCPSGPTEILQNGQCGILVNVDNPLQLAEAIILVLDDQVRLSQLKQLSKERAKDFALDKICLTWQADLENMSKK